MIEFFTPSQKTWLYNVNPATKFVLFFTLFIVIFFNQNLLFTFHVMVFSSFLFFFLSGYPLKKLLLLSIPIALSFFSSAISMILFGRGEIIWWQWGIVKVSEESFYKGLLLGCKAISFGMIGLTFVLTTRPILLFYALMQKLRLPPKYAYSFIAAFRLVPMVAQEVTARSHARKVRQVHFPNGPRGMYERLKFYIIPLFAQSIRRAQRLAVAMEAKQFQINGRRTYYYETPFSKWDLVFTCMMGLSVIASYIIKY